MTAPTPATISNDIVQQINELIGRGHFADPSGFEVKRLATEINKLKRADAKCAFKCQAALSQACGNDREMRQNFKNARDLGYDIENIIDEMTGLANLGYISESHSLFSKLKPENGEFSKLVNLGWNILAFNMLNAYSIRIERMATEINNSVFDRIHETAAFLQRHGVDDAVIAEIADIAGQLLREHQLFTSNEPVNTTVDEDLDCLFIEYELHTTPTEAAKIYAEFSRRLASRYDVVPQHIHIDMVARV